jgi:hypothetical protein
MFAAGPGAPNSEIIDPTAESQCDRQNKGFSAEPISSQRIKSPKGGLRRQKYFSRRLLERLEPAPESGSRFSDWDMRPLKNLKHIPFQLDRDVL